MITRSAKRKSAQLECNSVLLQVPGNEIQIQCGSYTPPGNKQFKKSVFNISIRSPGREISNIKISMEVPFENNSEGRNYVELGSNVSPRLCLTDNVSKDTNELKNSSPKSSKGSHSSKKSNSNKTSKNNSNTTFKNSTEISSCKFDIDSIKLNKAVVVLTDICKTKYYKAAFADNAAKGFVQTNGIETRKDVGNIVVKQESLESSTDDRCTNTTDSTFDSRPSLEPVNAEPLSGSRLLTQLAEGCSFSEILNRFRIKNGNCLVDTLKCADTTNQENFNTEYSEDLGNIVLKSETCSSYEDESTMEMTSEVTEKIESIDFEDSKLLGLSQGSQYEESRENIEHLRNQFLDSHMGSDHIENATAAQSISGDVSADEETVDSSCLTSNVKPETCNVTTSEEICSVTETSENHLSTMDNSDLNLHESEHPNLKESMKAKKLLGVNKSKSKKNKRPKSPAAKPRTSSSPKKMKQSDQKPETSHSKPKLPDEYIPLQISGPTKFGVAMLNQIKPYVHHDAKDFKNKVLFGDRNKRHSFQQSRMYKLKQQVNRSVRG